MVEALWVQVCLTLLLCMTLSGFLVWEGWLGLCNGPVQTHLGEGASARVCVGTCLHLRVCLRE